MLESSTSLEGYARKILPEAQLKKFRYRQDLLIKALEHESQFPEVENVLLDVFIAVRERDYKKFLMAHRQLNGRVPEMTLVRSIRDTSLSKKEIPCGKCSNCRSGNGQLCQKKKKPVITKREAFVLQELSAGKSLMEVF